MTNFPLQFLSIWSHISLQTPHQDATRKAWVQLTDWTQPVLTRTSIEWDWPMTKIVCSETSNPTALCWLPCNITITSNEDQNWISLQFFNLYLNANHLSALCVRRKTPKNRPNSRTSTMSRTEFCANPRFTSSCDVKFKQHYSTLQACHSCTELWKTCIIKHVFRIYSKYRTKKLYHNKYATFIRSITA